MPRGVKYAVLGFVLSVVLDIVVALLIKAVTGGISQTLTYIILAASIVIGFFAAGFIVNPVDPKNRRR